MRISQREARRLRKRVQQLEEVEVNRRAAYGQNWPGGVNIASIGLKEFPAIVACIGTARKLGHAVVVTESNFELRFHALPHPKADL